jgi:S-adenosylmethionine:tRNA-ribosyltransferase-isomerase (queuine synthetase)
VLEVADALLGTMHEPGASHFELLSAFAAAGGYGAREFGDAVLILPGAPARDP